MAKDWLCDGGNSGEKDGIQRYVVNELACCLSVCCWCSLSLTEAKDHRQAHKEVNDQLVPPYYYASYVMPKYRQVLLPERGRKKFISV